MTARKWKPTPSLRAGTYTADQVLAWVDKVIAEEPKRLDMELWFTALGGESIRPIDPGYVDDFAATLPACGSVACAAGWILLGTRNENNDRGELEIYSAGERAVGVLGLHYTSAGSELRDLFNDTGLDVESVRDRIARIRATYAGVLQHRRIVVLPRKRAAKEGA